MRAARLLGLTDGVASEDAQAGLARGFQLFVLLHVSARTLLWALKDDDHLALRLMLPAGLALCFLVAARRPAWARRATLAALLLLSTKLFASFPGTSNHFFIEYCCVALLTLCDLRDAGERALALNAARWLMLIVLFWSGVQKVLYGTYFNAAFLGFSVAHKPSFAAVFAWLLPAEELARLQGLRATAVGSGPFAINAPLARLVANGAYLFEIVAPCLLLWRRTRVWAVLATIGFLVCIEAGARELMFGALFVNLLLLFLPRPVNRVLLPGFAAFYAVLIATRLGLLPKFQFN
ncbi:MAG: hypothetical protein SF182_13630 [Deltaproteobacteria bacterium]|nr:hypothetical protein [Deltaproteobacteria bacterium]